MKRKKTAVILTTTLVASLSIVSLTANGAVVSNLLNTTVGDNADEYAVSRKLTEAVSENKFKTSDYEKEEVLHISSVEDFNNFAKLCSSDSASKGRTFVLDNDIDLAGQEFSPIPVFDGYFNGQGHIIKGIDYEGKEGLCGLFRYIQKDGVVDSLSVVGVFSTDSKVNNLGGICGVNEGIIINCIFSGSVSGYAQVGGIAGLNTGTGTISGCSSYGVISSSYYTGGIAGYSNGVISGCKNSANVNSDEEWVVKDDVTGLDWLTSVIDSEQQRTTSGIDTGGVVGYSKGIVLDSVNYGTVGYDHVGYNAGGIAGRQAGYLAKCNNYGKVKGRKDVGGVVGQMEPFLKLDETESLTNAIDELHRLVDVAIVDMEGQSNTLSSDIKDLSNHSDTVFDLTHQTTEQTVDVAERMVSNAHTVVDSVNINNYMSEDEKKRLEEYQKEIDTHSTNVADARTLQALNLKAKEHENDSEKPDLTEEEKQKRDELKNDPRFSGKSAVELEAYITSEEAEISKYSKKCTDIMAPAVVEATENYPDDLDWSTFDDSYKNRLDAIYEETRVIGDIIDRINANANGTSTTVLEDYRDINDQVNRILNLFNGKIDSVNDKVSGNLYNDISDESIEKCVTGKVERCQNSANIYGDINIGGIVGNMGIDEDDPEDNAAGEVEISTDTYLSSCILVNSKNTGVVTAKKNGVGGIAGYMSSGALYKCTNTGKVSSTTGDYAGGICGQSDGIIRSCDAICTVSALKYVGGIAGEGYEVRDCRSMVELTDYDSYKGAICGDIKKNSLADFSEALLRIKNNYYVDNGIGGINGIGFAANACPVKSGEMKGLDGSAAEEFRKVTITYVADDKIVDTKTYEYGAKADNIDQPKVPSHYGEYGVWEEIPTETLRSNYVLEAVYESYVTTIFSEAQVDGKTAVFAEGKFTDNCTVQCTVSSSEEKPYKGQKYSIKITHNADHSSDEKYNYRIYNTVGEKAVVYQNIGGQWKKIDSEIRGSYIQINDASDEVEYIVAKKSFFR